MSQHYTLTTIQTEAWCKKCNGMTTHRVSHRRLQFCIPCWNKSEAESIAKKAAAAAAPHQESLFPLKERR